MSPQTFSGSLSYETFETEAKKFFALSQELCDDWTLKISPVDQSQIYLTKVSQFNDYSTEYHIIYSVAFGVPTLYFRRSKANGEILWNFPE